MNVKRIVILAVVALLVCLVCTSCGGGPVSAVKGFMRAFMQGDAKRINVYLDEDMQIPDEVSNIWEEMDEIDMGFDMDIKDYKKAMGKTLGSAKYELKDQEDDEATVKVILDLKSFAQAMLRAVKDKELRKEMAEELKDADEDDFIEKGTFELELIDGKWLITDMRGLSLFYMF